MEKLMKRWNLKTPWQVIIILVVFSITGSSSIAIGRPILKFIGITLENLHAFIYYPLFIMIGFILYQVFLILYGWLFGQFLFFWNMEKKMLRRFGITIK